MEWHFRAGDAVVKAITHWDSEESLLLGHPFVVETDHKSLCFMYKSDNPKVVRWRTRLSEYAFSKCAILQELTIQSPIPSVGYAQFRFPLPAQSVRCK